MYLEEINKMGVHLSKQAMKQVMGGYGSQNHCRVYIPQYGWSGCTTLGHAQGLYNGGFYGVTGYCCAGCATMCY